MLKGKIVIWITVIAVCFGVTFFWNNIPKWTHKDIVSASFDVSSDKDMPIFVTDKKIGKVKVITGSLENDVIISDSIEQLNGFKKIDNLFYSPIVGFVSHSAINNPEGFIRLSSSTDTRQIDLKVILEGMENDSTWKDIGVSTKVVKGNIILTIPNETSPYYKDVENLFYITLNSGKEVTDEDREVLENRVNNILSKCDKVSSILDAIMSEHTKPSSDGKFFIGPEYLMVHLGEAVNSQRYSNTFIQVYFSNNVFLTADCFLKSDYSDGNNLSNLFYEYTVNGSDGDFSRYTGWRVQGSTFNMQYIKATFMKVLNFK